MLVIWTGAKATPIKKVVGEVIYRQPIEHSIFNNMEAFPEFNTSKVVLAMGAKAHAWLKANSYIPKNRTIGSLRGSIIKVGESLVLLTYDPGLADIDATKLPEIQWDVALAIRLTKTGTIKPVLGQTKKVESFHNVIQLIEQKFAETGKPVDVACDLETKGLDEYNPEAWIISCSMTVETGKAEVVYFEKGEFPVDPLPWERDMSYWELLWVQINWILTTKKVSIRGANFKFDSRWLNYKWDIYCTNNKFDTVLVGSLIDENRSNSLKLHAKIYTPYGGYDDAMSNYDMGALETVPVDELVEYNGMDTIATLDIATVLKTELLKDKKLTNFYVNIMQPASKAFEHMERNGVLVDHDYYLELKEELTQEISALALQMIAVLPNKLRIKHRDSINEALELGKSPLKPKLLKEFLFSKEGLNMKPLMVTEKTKEPSTAVDHLLMLDEHYSGSADSEVFTNFINTFKAYGSADKTLSTYVTGFLKHLRSDGRFHPTYMLFRGVYGGSAKEADSGTVTGRTSAKDPAMQTLPKHTKWTKRLRRAFIAPPGKVILNLDYSQGELRIVAVVAEEPTMLAAYQDNLDLHAVTGAKLSGYSYDDFMLLPEDIRDPLRSMAKPANFGLLYGMQHKGYRVYAQTSYGIAMSEEEAFKAREAFFSLYSRLLPWHEHCIKFAHKHEHIRNPLGRIRHLPMINCKSYEVVAQQERQSINTGIQSTLSDMMQWAMSIMDQEYGDTEAEMCFMTHDNVGFYIPEGEEILWGSRFKDIMENLPLKKVFGWDSPLRYVADAEVSIPDEDGVHSLALMTKVKFKEAG